MIDGASDYRLETGQQGVDVLISMAAGLIIPTTVLGQFRLLSNKLN